jgi:hypothetical protein
MKTQTHLHIAAPCHQDWNAMTPTEKGRFCESCASQVIDFTALTDHQVLAYLANANGKVCGRFNEEQLDRALHSINNKPTKVWQWALASVASLFFAAKSMAQTKASKQLATSSLLSSTQQHNEIKEAIASTTIKGTIVNGNNETISHAVVTEAISMNKVFVNRDGQFVMQVPSHAQSVLVRANGYDARVVPVNMLSANNDTTIVLGKEDTTITSAPGFDKKMLEGGPVIMGGIINYTEIDKPAPVITFVKKVFNNAFFKIQPNPTANGKLSLSINKAGTYMVQVFNNNSKLVHMAEVTVNIKGQIVSITLPNCVVKGTYFVRVIDQKTKKEYVDRMIVG